MRKHDYTTEEIGQLRIGPFLRDMEKASGYKRTELLLGQSELIGYEINTVSVKDFSIHHFFFSPNEWVRASRRQKRTSDRDDEIMLDVTPCNYGGYRFWFKCPDCGKRVGILYALTGRLICRTCANLSYESQKENRRSAWFSDIYPIRKAYKARRLREQIKRTVYAGRDTKKQRRVKELNNSYLKSLIPLKGEKSMNKPPFSFSGVNWAV